MCAQRTDHLKECKIGPTPGGPASNTATPNTKTFTDSKVVYTATTTDQLVKGYKYKICFAANELSGSQFVKKSLLLVRIKR